ncbi:hypothetical protein ABZ958_32195 [Streptomyces sp. NPDC046237]|uniref:hypothetical protein n=1 Tax=Streptomyces sp. NPDC046237 TaxID=3154914 RepID=UPI0033D6BF50
MSEIIHVICATPQRQFHLALLLGAQLTPPELLIPLIVEPTAPRQPHVPAEGREPSFAELPFHADPHLVIHLHLLSEG